MARVAFDLSSLMHTCLNAGKDPEARLVIDAEGKQVSVNTARFGYENAVNSIVATLDQLDLAPVDAIFVVEGLNSKAPRVMIDRNYKAARGKRPTEAYEEFATLRDQLKTSFQGLGSIFVTQDNCEADDVLAWLAENTKDTLYIRSNDADLLALQGRNKHGADVHAYIGTNLGINKYGDFDCKYVSLYKAMVGDPSDGIPGIKGFGAAAWARFAAEFGEAGMAEMVRMLTEGSLDELAGESLDNKMVATIYNNRVDLQRCWKLAKLHPEWVNQMGDPILWEPGFVHGPIDDERLRKWRSAKRLVTASNFAAAKQFFISKLCETPFFSLDLETSTCDESDDWIAAKGGKGIDVIGSRITGGSITFGSNTQYGYYITVDHKDSNNVTLEQFAEIASLIPAEKLTVAHNAAGFEIPVLFMHFKELWANNGWRGMLPNMVDTRIAATYWDENQLSHGLKQLSKLIFGYDQESYNEVTGGLRMNQIEADRVVSYGCDDAYVSSGLWNFFSLVMQLEGSYNAFFEYEQKPMYLQARAYVEGLKIDMSKLAELSAADDSLHSKLSLVLDKYLVEKGWEGTVRPVFTELTPSAIKQAVQVVLGVELVTMVRTPLKLAPLIEKLGEDNRAKILAAFVLSNDVEGVNKLVSQHFAGKPNFNTGSPKQLQALLYGTLGAPVRLRNKPTPIMLSKGLKEGQPRTDEDAINMAIRRGDLTGREADIGQSLIALKSIGTRRGLYWEPYPKMLHWITGKIHPSLRQSNTNTRRFTANDPNIQQMDSGDGGVRCVILPHHRGAVVVSLDESAQEVRQMADYCKDKNLLTCYLGTEGELRDVHSIVASRIAGCSYEDFRVLIKGEDKAAKSQRQAAKITLFATLYGAGAAKIAEGLGITQEEAQEYIDSIYAQFPGVVEWKQAVERRALQTGNVLIHGGTIRHLSKLITSGDKGVSSKAMRQAGNASIQSAGGNQIKRVMSRVWDSNLLDDYDFRWYFSIHDEVVISVGREHAVDVTRVMHGFMTEQFLDVVPSSSSIGVGRSFGNLVELPETFDAELLEKTVESLFTVA